MKLIKPKVSKEDLRGKRGFSLVEVTLAIGITAVALVSLMGMLPKGMATLQRANDKAVMGRINQQILGEIQLTSWEESASNPSGGASSQIRTFDRQIRYYDDQGIELTDNEKGGFRHVYTARIRIPDSGEKLPMSVGEDTYGGAVLPGDSLAGSEVDRDIRLVLVEITGIASPVFQENPEAGFDDDKNRKLISTYQTLVVRMGQDYNYSE